MKPVLARLSLLMMTTTLAVVLMTACSKEKSFENGTDFGDMRIREYPLNSVGSSNVDGTITFAENPDSSVTIMVTLNRSIKDTTHVLHLHRGTTSEPGIIAITLASVKGTGDKVQSITNGIREAVSENGSIQKVTFDDMVKMQGFVDVHQSVLNQQTVLAQGKIGI